MNAPVDVGGTDLLSLILGARREDGLDVTGLCFADITGGGWPSLLVELRLQAPQVGVDAGGQLTTLADHLPGVLVARGLQPVGGVITPPEVDKIRYTVRLRGTGSRPSGLYGPGGDGDPSRWVVMSPLPPWPALFDSMLVDTGGQLAVYVSTHTHNLAYADGPKLLRVLGEQASAGRLFGTRAAVLP